MEEFIAGSDRLKLAKLRGLLYFILCTLQDGDDIDSLPEEIQFWLKETVDDPSDPNGSPIR